MIRIVQQDLRQRLVTMTNKLIYIACPYSSPNFSVRHYRFTKATQFASHLIKDLGYQVYSPITHGHLISLEADLTTEWSFWAENCKIFLGMSKWVFVLCLNGWEQSVGVQAEIDIARNLGLRICYFDSNFDLIKTENNDKIN